MVFFTVMMVYLHQHFFNLFYDYFQTNLNNYICMSQFSSQTRTFSAFPIFFRVQDTHTDSLGQSDLAPEPPCFSPGLHQQPRDWMQDRNFTAVSLFQCLPVTEALFHPLPFSGPA